MSNFIYEAGKMVGKMKRQAVAFERHPPIWAIVVAGPVIWITMQGLKAML